MLNKKHLLLLLLLAISSISAGQITTQNLIRNDTLPTTTYSITKITSDNFNKSIVNNPMGLLQGKVAGLNIVKNGGSNPTQNTYQILLRSVSTFGNTEPLYIVDGIPTTNLNTVQAEDIETFEILKDGSTAAIYGINAYNGVVIITTKRGYNGKPSIEYNGDIGFGIVAKRPRVLNAEEYRKYMVDKGRGIDYGGNTDWFDELVRVPVNTSHTLSIAGGGNNFKYRGSINYKNLQGLAIKNGYEAINARLIADQSAFKNRLHIAYNFAYAGDKRNLISESIFSNAIWINPTAPVRLEQGHPNYGIFKDWFVDDGYFYNPVADVMESEWIRTNNAFFGSINASIDITDWLSLSTVYSLQDASLWDKNRYVRNFDEYAFEYQQNKERQHFTETILRFAKSIKKHNLQAMFGYSYQKNLYNNNHQSVAGLGSYSYRYNEHNTITSAFFGRIGYSWNDMLYFNASLRADGSSMFLDKKRWDLLPAGSIAWRITQLPALRNNKNVNELKLRFGYGITKNLPYNVENLQYYNYDNNFESVWDLEATHEAKQEYNLGFDFVFLNNRLMGTIDGYLRNIKDFFWSFPIYSFRPPNYSILRNAGNMQGKGIELSLNALAVKKNNFEWNIGLTIAADVTKVTKFTYSSTIYNGNNMLYLQNGEQTGIFYGLEFANIDENGVINYYNKTGEIVPFSAINYSEDRKILGNANPYFRFGLNTTISWNRFDLYLGFRGQVGGLIFNETRYIYEHTAWGDRNVLLSTVDANAAVSKDRIAANIDWTKNYPIYSSFYLEDASYLKLSDLALTFNCPLSSKVKEYMKSLKFRLTAHNVFTITAYSGIDPEVSLAPAQQGFDSRLYYPHQRTFLFGISAVF